MLPSEGMAKQINIRPWPELRAAILRRCDENEQKTGIRPSETAVVRAALQAYFNVSAPPRGSDDDEQPAPKAKTAKKAARK